MQKQPIAFMSYAHDDDKPDGRLTWFCERLSNEVHTYTGKEFPIFQDKNDIRWGQAWQERIAESIDGVTFFIPIISPRFLASQACRGEVERFRDREQVLRRTDLILPVYYVDCPLLNEERRRVNDDLAQLIYDHQFADWRELRFEPLESPKLSKELARLAIQIRDALEPTPSVVPPPVPKPPTEPKPPKWQWIADACRRLLASWHKRRDILGDQKWLGSLKCFDKRHWSVVPCAALLGSAVIGVIGSHKFSMPFLDSVNIGICVGLLAGVYYYSFCRTQYGKDTSHDLEYGIAEEDRAE